MVLVICVFVCVFLSCSALTSEGHCSCVQIVSLLLKSKVVKWRLSAAVAGG